MFMIVSVIVFKVFNFCNIGFSNTEIIVFIFLPNKSPNKLSQWLLLSLQLRYKTISISTSKMYSYRKNNVYQMFVPQA